LLIDSGGPQLDAIPTVGFSDPILSYFSALRFVFDGISMLKYGYRNVRACLSLSYSRFPRAELTLPFDLQKRRGLFKIAAFRRWMVFPSDSELVEDVRKAPDDVLSLDAAMVEVHVLFWMLDLVS